MLTSGQTRGFVSRGFMRRIWDPNGPAGPADRWRIEVVVSLRVGAECGIILVRRSVSGAPLRQRPTSFAASSSRFFLGTAVLAEESIECADTRLILR